MQRNFFISNFDWVLLLVADGPFLYYSVQALFASEEEGNNTSRTNIFLRWQCCLIEVSIPTHVTAVCWDHMTYISRVYILGLKMTWNTKYIFVGSSSCSSLIYTGDRKTNGSKSSTNYAVCKNIVDHWYRQL